VLSKEENSLPVLLVGQTGNNYATINSKGEVHNFFSENSKQDTVSAMITERKGPLKRTTESPDLHAICTSEGNHYL
jgi:hypothetical protein